MKFFVVTVIVFNLLSCGESLKDLRKNSIKKQQYYVEGLRLYRIYCENCHQKNGTGVGKLIPPLKSSDFLLTKRAASICAVKYGLQGKIEVNGVIYNHPMPNNELFADLDIAEVLTYTSNAWGNESSIITLQEIRQALDSCP